MMTESSTFVQVAFIMDIIGFWTRDPSNVARELYHCATQHFFILCVRFLILVIYYWHGSRLINMELKGQRG